MNVGRVSRIVGVFMVGVLGIVGTAGAQGIGVGVKGGIVFPDFSSDVFDVENRTGWQAGLFVGGNRNGVVGVQGEFNFLQKRALSEHELVTDAEVTVNYLQIPVLLRVHNPSQSAAGFQLYGIVGPSFDIKINETLEGLEIDEGFEGFDVGIIFGGGIEVGRIILEGRYSRGLRNVSKNFSDVVDIKTHSFAVLAGVRFN